MKTEGEVYYTTPIVPVTFQIGFDGSIQILFNPQIVTPIGTFGIDAGVEFIKEPGTTVVVIRHWRDGTIVDDAYRVAEEVLTVDVDGHTRIEVSDGRVFIDASDGSVTNISIGEPPGAAAPSTGATRQQSAPFPQQPTAAGPPATQISTVGTPNAPLGHFVGDAIALPRQQWQPFGDASISVGTQSGAFMVTFDGTWWGGAHYDAVPWCNYALSGWARNIDSDTYAFTVRADLSGDDPIGRAFQYDPPAGGYRDTEYPESESTDITVAETDNEWHWIDMGVLGSSYAVMVDGVLVKAGHTSLTCGGVFLRMVRGSAEFRGLEVRELAE